MTIDECKKIAQLESFDHTENKFRIRIPVPTEGSINLLKIIDLLDSSQAKIIGITTNYYIGYLTITPIGVSLGKCNDNVDIRHTFPQIDIPTKVLRNPNIAKHDMVPFESKVYAPLTIPDGVVAGSSEIIDMMTRIADNYPKSAPEITLHDHIYGFVDCNGEVVITVDSGIICEVIIEGELVGHESENVVEG